jgi:type VI secretion system secreted protein Hcp
MICRNRSFGVLTAVFMLLVAPAQGAMDMFLDLGADIPGESTDAVHRNKVDVLAWSWGMHNTIAIGAGGGGSTAGKVSFQDLSITKWVDKASPKLMLACARGTHIPEVKLIVRKAGEKPFEIIRIKLINAFVTSLSTGGSGGEDRLTESISLTFEKVEYEYVLQKPDGSADTPVVFKWNVAANVSY